MKVFLFIVGVVIGLLLGYFLFNKPKVSQQNTPTIITSIEYHTDTLPTKVITKPNWIHDTTFIKVGDSIPKTFSEYGDTIGDSATIVQYFIRSTDLDSFSISWTPIWRTREITNTIFQPEPMELKGFYISAGLLSTPQVYPQVGFQYLNKKHQFGYHLSFNKIHTFQYSYRLWQEAY